MRRRLRERGDAARARHRDDDFSDMSVRGHQLEGVNGVIEAERGDREHPQLAGHQLVQKLLQQLAVTPRPQAQVQIQVDHRK
ncbi:hypothetical protein NIIDMKKI_12230 [Mycobacterium kansasii]|uniref:Uncharacterized protein n=1 Tax=Mycobacterium kansasii TaxID=1768 RepID=A0A7G1I4U3_MYCKA|nr:hypothetical protein NIIDMKKI_12230 [Mycobacterium kansasii]